MIKKNAYHTNRNPREEQNTVENITEEQHTVKVIEEQSMFDWFTDFQIPANFEVTNFEIPVEFDLSLDNYLFYTSHKVTTCHKFA